MFGNEGFKSGIIPGYQSATATATATATHVWSCQIYETLNRLKPKSRSIFLMTLAYRKEKKRGWIVQFIKNTKNYLKSIILNNYLIKLFIIWTSHFLLDGYLNLLLLKTKI